MKKVACTLGEEVNLNNFVEARYHFIEDTSCFTLLHKQMHEGSFSISQKQDVTSLKLLVLHIAPRLLLQPI
jgi:hypothetical protein